MIYRFCFLLLLTFGFWHLFYEFFLAPCTYFDEALVWFLGKTTALLLAILGFESSFLLEKSFVILANRAVLHIGITCNGQDLLALNTCIALAFPVKNIQKIKLILFGFVLINLLNIFRLVALSINFKYDRASFDFNHHLIFPIFVYAIIFLLWKYSLEENAKKTSNSVIYLIGRYILMMILILLLLLTWQSRAWISLEISHFLAEYNFFGIMDTLIYALFHGILGLFVLGLFFWKKNKLFFQFVLIVSLFLCFILGIMAVYKFTNAEYLHLISETLIYFYFSPYPFFLLFLYGILKE